jgi:signal transduction histidine kinase
MLDSSHIETDARSGDAGVSLHETQVESEISAHPGWMMNGVSVRHAGLARSITDRIRLTHPIVAYRVIGLALAILVIGSHLHAQSSLRSDMWIISLAIGHIVATQVAAARLPRQSTIMNAAAIAVDIAVCVFLLSMTYGWRGPFWLYAISAVFWPSVRFSFKGAIISVIAFDALVLGTNFDRIRETVSDGFGGDLAARGLMVLFVASAIALTAQAIAKVQAMATEAERHRIARDLHDGVGKTMGGISLEARSLAQWIERDPAEASRRARYVARISERAANEVRDVIRGLRQSEATATLVPAVQSVIDDWKTLLGVPIRLSVSGQDAKVPVLIKGEIVRVLDELLRNVAQHSGATHVRVRLTLSNAGVTLSVKDDGRGFDPAMLDPWSGDGHFGLLGTRERTSMLGGYCRIKSAKNEGTDVTVDIPLGTRTERSFWVPDVFRPSDRL